MSHRPQLFISLLPFFFFALFCKFFVEDPGGAIEDVLTTGPPEVLVFTPHMNLSNDSLSDYQGENAGGNKFYLPVSLWNGIFFAYPNCQLSEKHTLKHVGNFSLISYEKA